MISDIHLCECKRSSNKSGELGSRMSLFSLYILILVYNLSTYCVLMSTCIHTCSTPTYLIDMTK